MDQQLFELIEELKRLIPVLKSMSSTRGTEDSKSSDRSTDRIVNALARLTATIDTNNKTKAQQERSMEKFTSEVDKATDAQIELRKAQEDAAKAAEEAAKETAELTRRASLTQKQRDDEDKKLRKERQRVENEQSTETLKNENRNRTAAGEYVDEMLRGATVSGALNKQFETLAGESVPLNLAFRGVAGALEGVMGTIGALAKSTGKFVLAVGEGNTKFTSLNPIIDSVAGALGKMVSTIPFVGKAMEGAIQVVAEGSKFVINQLQQASESFNELGQVGALTANGMTGVQESFLKSGMTLDGFKKTVVENSSALAKFSGTVGDGRDRLVSFVGDITTSDAGDALRRLGYSADQIGETAGTFVAQQTRLGLAQNKTQAQLKQGTIDYAKELDLLSKVTGMNRKAIQQQQDAALSEGRFRAQTDEMIAQGNEKGAKALLDFQTQVANISPELGSAIRDVSTGFTNSEAAIKGFNASGGKIQEIVEAVKSGQIDQGEAMRRLQAATRENEETQRGLAKAAGDSQDVFVKYAELSDFNRAAIEGNTIKAQRAQDAQVAGQDALTNNTVDAQKSLEQMSRQIANFGFAVMPEAAKAVKGFTGALNEFIKYVAKQTGMQLPEIGGDGKGTAAAPEAAKPVTVQKAEAQAAQTRKESDAATEKQAILEDQKKAALAELEAMQKAGATREERRKQEEKIIDIEKKRVESEKAEIEAANKARQAALEAKNERQRILRLQNTVAPIEKEITGNKVKLTGLKDKAEDQAKAIETEKDPNKKAAMNYTLKRQKQEIADLEASIKEKEAKLADIQKQIKPAAAPTASAGGGRGTAHDPRRTDATAYIQKLIAAESGGKNIANRSGQGGTSTSTAFGLTQFTKGTFEGMVKQAGKDNPLYGKTWDDYKADTNLQLEATRQLTEKNRQTLASNKLSTTDAAMYLAHFLGATGATKVLSANDNTPLTDVVSAEQLQANPQLQRMSTVADIKAWADNKMGGVGYARGGVVPARAGGTTITVGEGGRNEAVVPLLDGKSIPVQFGKETTESFKNFAKMFSVDVKTPLAEIIDRSLSGITSNITAQMQADVAPPNYQEATATMIDEFKRSLNDIITTMQQPKADNNQDLLIATLQDMIKEQRNTVNVSQRLLQVAQN